MPSIFLSHSSKDKVFVSRIARDLREREVEVWLDEWEIKVGDSITQKVSRGLDDMELVVVFLSEKSINSGWVEKEWHSKIGEEASDRRAIILPALIEDCVIPRLLKDKRYADFRTDYDAGFEALLQAIRWHTPRKVMNLFLLGFNVEHPIGYMGTIGYPSDKNVGLVLRFYDEYCRLANRNSRLVVPDPGHVLFEGGGDPNAQVLGPLTAFDWQTLRLLDNQLLIKDVKSPFVLMVIREKFASMAPEFKKFFLREENFRQALDIWQSSKDPHGKCPIRFFYRADGNVRAEKVEGTP